MCKALISLMFTALFAVGGARSAYADQAFWGGALGAGLGGLLGSQFGRGDGQLAATGLGVATGALVGSSIGQSMDRADRAYYGRSYYGSSPFTYASPVYRQNYVAPPEPDVRVIYVPQNVYVTGSYVGTPSIECREYTQTTRIGGRVQQAHGTACLQPDGTWRIQ